MYCDCPALAPGSTHGFVRADSRGSGNLSDVEPRAYTAARVMELELVLICFLTQGKALPRTGARRLLLADLRRRGYDLDA